MFQSAYKIQFTNSGPLLTSIGKDEWIYCLKSTKYDYLKSLFSINEAVYMVDNSTNLVLEVKRNKACFIRLGVKNKYYFIENNKTIAVLRCQDSIIRNYFMTKWFFTYKGKEYTVAIDLLDWFINVFDSQTLVCEMDIEEFTIKMDLQFEYAKFFFLIFFILSYSLRAPMVS
jgi:hypothetical protein